MENSLAKPVMDKIIELEKRRLFAWRMVFRGIVGVILFVVVVLLYQSWLAVQERGILDLLTLFQEDKEIIAEFWQDTLVIFWEELPQRRIEMAVLASVLPVVLFVVTRKARKIIRKKQEQIGKYSE